MRFLTSLIGLLPFPVQIAVWAAAGYFLWSAVKAAGWWMVLAALIFWTLAVLGYLHATNRLPTLFRRKWVMDILDRLTDKAGLQAMLNRKPVSRSRTIDEDALRQALESQVFGQHEVCRDVARQIRTRFAKEARSKPIGVFMLAGPPATGKTWFAKVLAEALYGKDSALIFEMAQLSDGHAASTLFGSPKGYRGSDSYGTLTAALRDKPDCVIVLDEFEKSDPDLHVRFLSAWNDGFVTEASTGEKISTTDAVFILTTNAAQRQIAVLGKQFQNDRDGYSEASRSALRDTFKPEVLSRIDRVFPFLPLEGMDLARVVARQLESGIKEFGVDVVQIEKEVLHVAIEQASRRNADPREIARMIEKLVDGQVVTLKDRGIRRVQLVEDVDGTIRVEPA